MTPGLSSGDGVAAGGEWQINSAPAGSARRIREQGERGREQVHAEHETRQAAEAQVTDRRAGERSTAAKGEAARTADRATRLGMTAGAKPKEKGEAAPKPETTAQKTERARSGYEVVTARRADRGLQQLTSRTAPRPVTEKPEVDTPESATRQPTTTTTTHTTTPTARSPLAAAAGRFAPTVSKGTPTTALPTPARTGLPTAKRPTSPTDVADGESLPSETDSSVTPAEAGVQTTKTPHDTQHKTTHPTTITDRSPAATTAATPALTQFAATQGALKGSAVGPNPVERRETPRVKDPSAVTGVAAGRSTPSGTSTAGATGNRRTTTPEGGVDAALDGAVGTLVEDTTEPDPYAAAPVIYQAGPKDETYRQGLSAHRELTTLCQSRQPNVPRGGDLTIAAVGSAFTTSPLSARVEGAEASLGEQVALGMWSGVYDKTEVRG